jgi:ATP-binding cassette subfamily B protein
MLVLCFTRFRFPVVRQHEQIDCGPAALLSVLKYHGGNASLAYVRQLCRTDAQGARMFDLVKAAGQLGLKAVGATGEYDDMMQEKMPCIAHVRFEGGLQHFVVVYRMTAQGLLIGDPANGLRKISRTCFLRIWPEKAVILFQADGRVCKQIVISSLAWVMGYVKRQSAWVHQTVFLGVVYTALGLLTAIFVQWLIDRFLPVHDRSKMLLTAIAVLMLLLLRAVAGFFRQRFLIALNKRVNIEINHDFLGRLFQLPGSFFDNRKTGDITARLNDSIKLQQAILLVLNTTIIDGMILVGSFVLLCYLAPLVAWLTLLLVPVYALLLLFGSMKIRYRQMAVMQSRAKLEASYIDSIQGIDTVLSFSASNLFTEKNRKLFCAFQDNAETLNLKQANLTLLAELFTAVLTVAVLGFGAIAVADGKMPLGKMMAAYSLTLNMLPAINRMASATITLQGAQVAAGRLRDVLQVPAERSEGKLPFVMRRSLAVCNGAFNWPKQQMLLNGLNLHIMPGRITGLTGPNGAGKSTLVQLIQRKYPLSGTQLKVDGIPAQRIDLGEYRSHVTVVPQVIKVFAGTIADNILLGRPCPDFDDMLRRIDDIGLGSFLSRFNAGLFTMIGENGRRLSGGEMQMLALIRALYDGPEVLILDEGLNAVDLDTDELLWSAIRRHAKRRAALVITHNLQALAQVDYLYEIGDGRVIREGSAKELLTRSANSKSLL